MDSGEGGYFASTGGAGGGGNEPQKRENTVRPATIRQLRDAAISSDGQQGIIDGRPIGRVSIVAKIIQIDKQETKADYRVEDGTGSIGLKQWMNNSAMEFGYEHNMDDHGSGEKPKTGADSVTEGDYAYFYCRCSPFNNRVAYVVDSMRPVTDHNEVAYHNVAALYAHMNERKELKMPTKSNKGQTNSSGNNGSLFVDGDSASGNAYEMEIRKQVVSLLKSHSNNEDGVPFATLKQACNFDRRNGHKSDEQVLRDALSSLCDQGSVYPTSGDSYGYCL